MGRLEGKVAFVTGAGGGIGQAVCSRFAEEGALVAAADISEEALAGCRHERILRLHCDITDPAKLSGAMSDTVARFGKLNVLCNAAGGSSPADARVTDAPDHEFWRVIKLDLYGTFLGCKYAIPEMVKAGGGSVINLSSMVALTALTERDCYTAAKGGVASMTRSMATEYAPHKIRVNAIAPGLVLTPRVRRLMDEREELRRLAAQHLLGPLEPFDVAHLAVFLASDESRMVTGQIISVDSGVTI